MFSLGSDPLQVLYASLVPYNPSAKNWLLLQMTSEMSAFVPESRLVRYRYPFGTRFRDISVLRSWFLLTYGFQRAQLGATKISR